VWEYNLVKYCEVAEYLDDGWRLHGSPVQVGTSGFNIYQAIIRWGA